MQLKHIPTIDIPGSVIAQQCASGMLAAKDPSKTCDDNPWRYAFDRYSIGCREAWNLAFISFRRTSMRLA